MDEILWTNHLFNKAYSARTFTISDFVVFGPYQVCKQFLNELFLFFSAKAKKRPTGAGKRGLFSEEEIPESKRPRVSPAPFSGGLGEGSGTSTPVLTSNEKSPQGSKKVPHK